jgi:SspJ family small acid-soluble spore protein
VRWNPAIAVPGSVAPITAAMPSDTPSPGRRHYAEPGQRKDQRREFCDYGQDQNRVAGNARQAGQALNDDSLEGTIKARKKWP